MRFRLQRYDFFSIWQNEIALYCDFRILGWDQKGLGDQNPIVLVFLRMLGIGFACGGKEARTSPWNSSAPVGADLQSAPIEYKDFQSE